MSSSDRARPIRPGRRGFLMLAAFCGLAGCFRPLLVKRTGDGDVFGQVALPKITDRFSYHMHERLEDRLGVPAAPAYRLTVVTELKETGLAVTQDNETTRRRLTAVAHWSLYRDGEADPVLKRRTISQSGFNSTDSLFAERVTRDDVERRLAEDLGERIARAILAQAPGIAGAPIS